MVLKIKTQSDEKNWKIPIIRFVIFQISRILFIVISFSLCATWEKKIVWTLTIKILLRFQDENKKCNSNGSFGLFGAFFSLGHNIFFFVKNNKHNIYFHCSKFSFLYFEYFSHVTSIFTTDTSLKLHTYTYRKKILNTNWPNLALVFVK